MTLDIEPTARALSLSPREVIEMLRVACERVAQDCTAVSVHERCEADFLAKRFSGQRNEKKAAEHERQAVEFAKSARAYHVLADQLKGQLGPEPQKKTDPQRELLLRVL